MSIEATTLETLKSWTKSGRHFNVFTCYDATTARWLALGGACALLVGDSAGRTVLGLEETERPSIDFMAAIGAAVGRGAPRAFIMVDYPDDLADPALDHGRRIRQLLRDTGANAIKVEGDAQRLQALVADPAVRSVPIVAHLRPAVSRSQCCGASGSNSATTTLNADSMVADALSIAQAGAAGILLEGVAPSVSAEVVRTLQVEDDALPVFGCNAGPACYGQVAMLHHLLGLGLNPPVSGPRLGQMIADMARQQIDALARDSREQQ